MSNRTFVFFDTETTGLETVTPKSLQRPSSIAARGSEAIQIGGLITGEDMLPRRLFCYYCDAVVAESSVEALDVHHVSLKESRKHVLGQFLPEVMTRCLGEFFANDTFFMGYNVDFDMSIVCQTLSNSALSFNWKKFVGPVLPKHGRYSVNVADYVKVAGRYRKLISFETELEEDRAKFFSDYGSSLSIDTNCLALLEKSWSQAHNSFFDALNTYLLWRKCVWGRKLV